MIKKKDSIKSKKYSLFLSCVFCSILLAACSNKQVKKDQDVIRQNHAPRIQTIVEEDSKSLSVGIDKASKWISPYFKKEWDDEELERQMRFQLQKMQRAPKGISELVVSPVSFVAVMDVEGKVIARDSEKDSMKGKNFAERFSIVKKVLAHGGVETALGKFEGSVADEPSFSILFVTDVKKEGKRVGAVMAGVPLWRLAQKLSRQLRAEHVSEINKGASLWVYLQKDGRFFHHATPPEITGVIEEEKVALKIQSLSSEGVVGSIKVHGRAFAWGAFPLSQVSDGVSVFIVRSGVN